MAVLFPHILISKTAILITNIRKLSVAPYSYEVCRKSIKILTLSNISRVSICVTDIERGTSRTRIVTYRIYAVVICMK
jgi:hypothetical protein